MPKRIPRYINTHPFFAQAIITIVTIIAFAILFIQQQNTQDDIVESQLIACVRGNELRTTLQQNLRVDKAQAKLTPREFFPYLTDEQFDSLLEQALERYDEQIKDLNPINCLEAYPAAKELDNVDSLLNPEK